VRSKKFLGLYTVFDDGRIFRNFPIKEEIHYHNHPKGYKTVSLRFPGGARNQFVHRVVLTAFRGQCPKGFEAAHKNGIPNDNRLSNLIWCTRKVNCSHKKLHGTHRVGSAVPTSKLNDKQVLEIRERRKSGNTLLTLSRRYGVSQKNISLICRREGWTHI